LPNLRGHALPQVDSPSLALFHENDRLELTRGRSNAHSSGAFLDADLQLVFRCNELSKDESAEPVIVLSLPIRKTTSEELLIAELESFAGLQPASRFLLRDILNAICAEERIDRRTGRFKPGGRWVPRAGQRQEDG
jgi:hypothetical protein